MSGNDTKNKKAEAWKLWGSILGTTSAVVGMVFAAYTWMDSAYASEADLTAKIIPVTAEIEVIKVAQSAFAEEIKELRKDRLKGQLRDFKRDKYKLKKIIDAGKATDFDVERLQELEFDIQDIEQRIKEIK